LQDLSVSDWEGQLQHMAAKHADGATLSAIELLAIREKKLKHDVKNAESILWFSDMSYQVTAMRGALIYLGAKVPHNMKPEQKLHYESLPIIARGILELNVFVPNCGIVVHAVGYEKEIDLLGEPGADASEQEKDAYKESMLHKRPGVCGAVWCCVVLCGAM
jgi:hypothetical protein